jgi:hypothetical protein
MMIPVVLLVVLSGAAAMMHKTARIKYQASEILG